jgi:hypothetical protein
MKAKCKEMAEGLTALKARIVTLQATLKKLRLDLEEWQQRANEAASSSAEIPCLPKDPYEEKI